MAQNIFFSVCRWHKASSVPDFFRVRQGHARPVNNDVWRNGLNRLAKTKFFANNLRKDSKHYEPARPNKRKEILNLKLTKPYESNQGKSIIESKTELQFYQYTCKHPSNLTFNPAWAMRRRMIQVRKKSLFLNGGVGKLKNLKVNYPSQEG